MKKGQDVAKMTDQQLLFDHAICVKWVKMINEGKTVEGWTLNDIIKEHEKVEEELKKRGYNLKPLPTAKREEAELEILQGFQPFKIREPFIAIVGSIANWERTFGDIDVLIYSPEGPSKRDILSLVAGALFERLKGFNLHLLSSLYGGPFTNYVPLFSLAVDPVIKKDTLSRYAPILPHQHPEQKATTLAEVLERLGSDHIILSENFIWFDFSRDPEVHVYFTLAVPPSMQTPFEFRIYRQFSQEFWSLFKFHYNEDLPERAIPGYNLILYRINALNDIIKMSHSRKEDLDRKIEIGKYFIPLKTSISPFHGYRVAEKFKISDVVDFMKKLAERRKADTEVYPCAVEVKYDGLRGELHKEGDKITIFSDDKKDITDRFPKTIEEAKKLLHGIDIILDAEIEMWVEGQHQPREITSGYTNADSPADDKNIVFNVFDNLAFRGKNIDQKDLSNVPWEDRRTLLDKISWTQSTIGVRKPSISHFNEVPTVRCSTVKQLEDALTHAMNAPASEGAMIKTIDSTYPLNGSTTEWVKLKKFAEVLVKIWDRTETKSEGVYNYDIALSFSNEIVPKNLIVKIGEKDFSKCGRTFNVAKKMEIGDVIKVRFHTMNHYHDPNTGEEFIHLYETAFYEYRGSTDKPDSISSALGIGEESGLLVEKTIRSYVVTDRQQPIGEILSKGFGLNQVLLIKRARDPYMEIPDDDGSYQYWMQLHYAAAAHGDLRMEFGDPNMLAGWTIMLAQPGVPRPESCTQFREFLKKDDYWKIDMETGEFKQRRRRGGTVTETYLLANRKQPEPKSWGELINYEAQPGEVGATKNYPGYIIRIDTGDVEYGSQKPYFHEYFMKGKLFHGRYMFRLATGLFKDSNEVGEVLRVLPPSQKLKEEGEFPGESWFLIQAQDQTPYVVSLRAIQQKWLPPKGFSALPKELRNKVPKELKYWETSGDEAQKMRLELRNQWMKDDVIREATPKFVLQYQSFRAKNKPIREGPTTYHWDIYIDEGRPSLIRYRLQLNPLENNQMVAFIGSEKWKEAMTYEGNPEPGHPLNPTKNQEAWIQVLDKGSIALMQDDPEFKKVEFHGKALKGLWVASKEKNTDIWTFKRSQVPEEA